MQWFRIWHDMLNDPKWRVIAQKSNTRVCEVVSVALAILNNASQNDERGVYNIEAEDIAAALDIDEQAVVAIMQAMQGRFLSDGKIINWEKRQPKREDNATERTRAWRERNKTQCDAPVTQCDAPDKIREDTDTEKNIINPLTPLKGEPTKAKKNANTSRSIAIILQDIAEIPADLYRRASSYGVTDIYGEWAKFRNHHISARSKHTRVDLCWDTWCRNAAKWQGSSAGNGNTNARTGSAPRRDIVAAASSRALAELYGVNAKGLDGKAAWQGADDACPFGDGEGPSEAVLVDVSPSPQASAVTARITDGSGKDSNA